MGADIHSYVERRVLTPRFSDRVMRASERRMLAGGEEELLAHESRHRIHWEHVPIATWISGVTDELAKWPEDHYIQHDPDIQPWYEWRNYGLFGILGGIRSRGGRLLESCHHRGLPEGFSGVVEEWKDNDGYYHSTTWYTCQELIDADIPSRMPLEYGVTKDVERFVQMNKDLVKKYGARNVRIILWWDN